MASIQKITYVYWVDREGRRVQRGTRGAKKVTEESAKWYGCWKEGSRQHRVPLATDKSSSQAMMTDLLRTKDRVKAGLVDPFDLNKPIEPHINDYLVSIVASGKVKKGKYLAEKCRILRLILSRTKVRALAELSGAVIDRYMDGLKCSVGTKRIHHTTINVFADWLVTKRRLASNPITSVARPAGSTTKTRQRRALKPAELQKLLDAARVRPLRDALYKPRGKSNRGKKLSAKPAVLRPDVLQRCFQIGRERVLIYKTAIYTGLRKNEITQLLVKHLNLNRKPYAGLELPGEFTKNGDAASLLLPPDFAKELKAWIADTCKTPEARLFVVPKNMVRIMKKDLECAELPFKDARGRVADFHSLRKTAGTMLGVAGVPARIRQLFMRHSDIRLTMQTYDDEDFSSLEEAVRALEKLALN